MSKQAAPEIDNTSDLYAVRKSKLHALKSEGQDPFEANWEQAQTAEQALAMYNEDEENSPKVSVAGRIVAFRLMGKAAFLKILDRSGKIQAYVKRDLIGEEEYKAFKKLDIGDIIGIEGTLFKTKTEEITVRANSYRLVSKSLRPLPEKWHGLTDNDQIYRERHLDLISNDESRARLNMRTDIIKEIRKYLWDKDFREVETPCLIGTPGGAAARPFVTHMNALSHDFNLRISLEPYLKRLLVGGMDRVFEIGRIFRNEGLSRKHNPEFTMMELYQAYTDYRGMMSLTRGLIQHICDAVIGTRQIEQADGRVLNLDGEWREAKYRDLVKEAAKDPEWFSRTREEKLAACEGLGIRVNPELEDFEIDNDVFEKLVEPSLMQPTFVTHLPKELCPLAKTNAEDDTVLDVFELCINGQEIAPAYSEQNDPEIQLQAFEAQAGEEKQRVDTEFVEAMEYGMPPAGGLGVGIDRLVILLTGASNIRDTILYPTLRPILEQTDGEGSEAE